jgi:hypothetical protein
MQVIKQNVLYHAIYMIKHGILTRIDIYKPYKLAQIARVIVRFTKFLFMSSLLGQTLAIAEKSLFSVVFPRAQFDIWLKICQPQMENLSKMFLPTSSLYGIYAIENWKCCQEQY